MLKDPKKLMFWFAVLFSAGTLLIQVPTFNYSFGERVYAIFMAIAVCYLAAVFQFDWEYMTRRVAWEIAAGKCPDQNFLNAVIHTDIFKNDKEIVIDIRQTKREGLKFGRWTVFYDQNSGVRLYRDEMRLKNCWYYAY